MQFREMNQHTLEDLKKAIERALESGELFDPEQLEQMRERLQQMTAEQREQADSRSWSQKLEDAGYVSFDGPPPRNPTRRDRAADAMARK